MVRPRGVTAPPGHIQPVPGTTVVLCQGCLEETLLLDTAAPAKMRRPFSSAPFSVPVHVRVGEPVVPPLHVAVLAGPAPLPLAKSFSNNPQLLLQRPPTALQTGLKTRQIFFKEFD